MRTRIKLLLGMTIFSLCGAAQAGTSVSINVVDEKGVGKSVGEVVISETDYGVVFSPSLADLPPGLHGFHVHENPSCQPGEEDGKIEPALAAGEHYAPDASENHGPPWGDGHLGDLPALFVDEQGNADTPVLAPRLEMDDMKGRALVIHAGGDNYSDHPEPSGGGGARVACGVIQ